jgi:hypothetical protein
MTPLLRLVALLVCGTLLSSAAPSRGLEIRTHDDPEHARKVPALDDVNALVQALHPIMEFHTTSQTTRNLQGVGDLLQIIQSACSLVGELMLIDDIATCGCKFGFTLEFNCTLVVPICAPGDRYCAQPVVTGGFDFLQTQVSFGYCSREGTFDGASIPDFCVAVSGNLIAPSSSSSNRLSSKFLSLLFPVKRQFLNAINVTVGGRSCRAASLCNEGQGYQFDCSNIDVRLKQSACTPLQTLMSLKQAPGSVTYLPHLDDPVPVPVPAPVSVPTSSFMDLLKRITPTGSSTTAKAPTKAPRGMQRLV